MAYDGQQWDETNPTNSTLANEIDDNMRDMKQGVSGRMRNEHVWPASQGATASGGQHSYISLQGQSASPSLPVVGTTTQLAVIWASQGSQNLLIKASNGSSYVFFNSSAGALSIIGAQYSATGSAGELIIGGSGGIATIISPATTNGQILISSSAASPYWAADTAQAFGAITVYGNSLSTGTAVTNAQAKVYVGQAALVSGTAVISGLGFTDATSFAVSPVRLSSADVSQAVQVSSQSATGFKLRDSLGSANTVNWIAIGK